MPAVKHTVYDFLRESPGKLFPIKEIADALGLDKRQTSNALSAAKVDGLDVDNPLPGVWRYSGPVPAATAAPEKLNDDQDDDQDDDEDEADEPATDSFESIVADTLLGGLNVTLVPRLTFSIVGHDREGHHIVTNKDGHAYRLVSL